jgi:hypothetical protein
MLFRTIRGAGIAGLGTVRAGSALAESSNGSTSLTDRMT